MRLGAARTQINLSQFCSTLAASARCQADTRARRLCNRLEARRYFRRTAAMRLSRGQRRRRRRKVRDDCPRKPETFPLPCQT
jgi:hypothetical protein